MLARDRDVNELLLPSTERGAISLPRCGGTFGSDFPRGGLREIVLSADEDEAGSGNTTVDKCCCCGRPFADCNVVVVNGGDVRDDDDDGTSRLLPTARGVQSLLLVLSLLLVIEGVPYVEFCRGT